MTQKELLKRLLTLLSAELEPFNFNVKLKEQGFIRKDNNAIYLFYFSVYTRTNIKTGDKGFLVEPFAYVNIPQIEKYYKEITLNTELKNDFHFLTIGNSIADMLANPDGIYRKRNESLDLFVFQDQHLQFVVSELVKLFKHFVLPFFLENNTIAKVDELLNSCPLEYSVYMSNDLLRFVKGLIAAKLNKNPRLDKLLSIYSNRVVEWDMPEEYNTPPKSDSKFKWKNILNLQYEQGKKKVQCGI